MLHVKNPKMQFKSVEKASYWTLRWWRGSFQPFSDCTGTREARLTQDKTHVWRHNMSVLTFLSSPLWLDSQRAMFREILVRKLTRNNKSEGGKNRIFSIPVKTMSLPWSSIFQRKFAFNTLNKHLFKAQFIMWNVYLLHDDFLWPDTQFRK